MVITDDLVMKAILNEYGEKDPIKMAINAGADLIISTCADDWFVDYVYDEVQEGNIDAERIDESVWRILQNKESRQVGIPETKGFDKAEGDRLSKDIARKGIILSKGEKNHLPIDLKEKKIGVVFGNPARLVMSDATNLYDISFKDIISRITGHDNVKEAIMPWHPTDEEIISLTDIGIISDVIIVSTVNGYRFTRQIEVLKKIRRYCPSKTIIGIASRSPMDAKLLKEYCDYVIVTGGITNSILEAVSEAVFLGTPFDDNIAKHPKFL